MRCCVEPTVPQRERRFREPQGGGCRVIIGSRNGVRRHGSESAGWALPAPDRAVHRCDQRSGVGEGADEVEGIVVNVVAGGDPAEDCTSLEPHHAAWIGKSARGVGHLLPYGGQSVGCPAVSTRSRLGGEDSGEDRRRVGA